MPLVDTRPPTPIRISSSFSLLDRIRSHKDVKPPRPPSSGRRSGSFNDTLEKSRQPTLFSMHAAEGAGMKARRMSANTPDEFVVDTCELDTEFVSASKLRLRKEVGRGASATVRVMIRKGEKNGDKCLQYAVKEFRKRSSKESEVDYVKKVKSEYTIAKSLHHPNIVETIKLCTNHGRWDHVMEYCQQGELYALVERNYLKQEDKLCIFKQVLKGVGYLHDHGIAHRDIKLENLLMTEQGHIKITDFGVSEVFRGEHPGVRSAHGECGQNMGEARYSAPGICGSKPYISPEVLEAKREYDPTKLDVWACAILYLTLYHSGTPWQSASTHELNYQLFLEGWEAFIERFGDTPIDENTYPLCGPVFQQLPTNGQRRCILKMMHPSPSKRCTINEVLADRWVKKIESCSPESLHTDSAVASASIDVTSKDSCRLMAKMKIQAKHDHIPPPVKRLPQHKFDMGDGY